MINLTLSPQRREDILLVNISGEVLIINGQSFDFTQLANGETLPRSAINCQWIAGDVQRIDGVLQVPLLLPISAVASDAARFPEPISVTQDGSVELPK